MNDKMYPVRLNKEKLDAVLKHCKSNKISFSKRVRELMEDIYDEIINDTNIVECSKAIRQNFKEIRKLQAEIKILKEESDEKEM